MYDPILQPNALAELSEHDRGAEAEQHLTGEDAAGGPAASDY